MLALGLGLAALLAGAAQKPPDRLGIYTFSIDSDAGFSDDLLDVFRRELAKHIDAFGDVSYSREESDVAVQFLGQGELEIELSASGTPQGYLFRPDDSAERMWVLVHVGEHSRTFSIAGRGARKMSELGKEVGDWVRERSSAIRERRLEK